MEIVVREVLQLGERSCTFQLLLLLLFLLDLRVLPLGTNLRTSELGEFSAKRFLLRPTVVKREADSKMAVRG